MPLSTFSVEVPEGAPPGTVLQVPVGNGRVAGLQVPEGAAAGTVLQFQVEIDDGEGGEDLSDSGPTYTSGEEDDSGPAILSPAQFRARHPNPSPHRERTRPYRTHYFHNQKDSELHQDARFAEILASPILTGREVGKLRYAEAIASEDSFDKYLSLIHI